MPVQVFASFPDELPDDAGLWMYMSFAKFMSMMHSTILFLSSIATIDAAFEGSN